MSTRPNRETAYRVFASEFEDANLSYAESDEERAPNYVVTPTGARINRLFVVGVLTEIESVNEEQLRARIVDPTGAFVVYAGQYQPEALSFLERAETPAFVAVTGKARTFQPEDSNRVFTSIRPETLSEVDAATRDRFTVNATERTIERIRTMSEALERDERGDALRDALEDEGVEAGLADGIARAIDHYGTTQTYLDAVREMALDAARVVAGEREEVGTLDVAPDEDGSADRTESSDVDETDTGVTVSDDVEPAPEAETGSSEIVAGQQGESTIEAESPSETDEPVTAETMGESEQSDTEIEDESTADDALEETEPTDETAEFGAGSGETDETDLADPEEFELDDEVRERIEDTYGTDFESAAEVGEPGEAGIQTPTQEGTSDSSEESASTKSDSETTEPAEEIEPAQSDASIAEATETDTTADTETELTEEVSDVETDESAESGDETETAIDPEEAVVAAMRELDDGDGAEREAIIELVMERYGLTREDAEDGIQSALMSGECYESDDDIFKPI